MTRNILEIEKTNKRTYLRPVDPPAHSTDPYGHWDLHLRGKRGGQRLRHITQLSKVRLLMLEMMDQDPGVGDLVEKLSGMKDRAPGGEVMHHRAGREQSHAKWLDGDKR